MTEENLSEKNEQKLAASPQNVEQNSSHHPVSNSEAPRGLNLIQKISDGPNPLHVKLPAYDGPLELLLELIKKNEMNVYDIQVSTITQQYLDYLAMMKQFDLEVAGEFIVMAATLIYIKSKLLLPTDPGLEDEDGGDPRAELVRKLLEYQAFKEAAKELGFLEHERGKIFTRQIADYYLTNMDAEDVGIDTFSADLYDLLSAFQTVLLKAPRETFHEVFEQVMTIEQRTAEIKMLIEQNKKILFSDLFKVTLSKNYLIVTFLAILELARMRFIQVSQHRQFGEIFLEKSVEKPQSNL